VKKAGKGNTKTSAKPKGKASPKKAPNRKSAKEELKGFKTVQGEVVKHAGLASVEEPLEPTAVPEIELEVPEVLDDHSTDDLDIPQPSPLLTDEKGLTAADPVTRYMAEIGRYPLLTKEQEREIAIRYRETGDTRAAEALVTSNLRFVVKVAAEYTKFGARLIDLVQEGNVGLMHAVKEFNPYKGNRLITYAVWWIRGYIQEYLMRQYSMVRIGTTANQRKLFYQLQRERDKLEREGLQAGIAQLSGRLGISPEEISEMQSRLSGRDVSLDAPVGDEGSASLLDYQSEVDPDRLDDNLGRREELAILAEKIGELRPTLSEKELFLLDARILNEEPMTLQEIGDKYGTTREAVRQMEARLMEKIKKLVVPT
jgi:RNA polymerase sigma-32 factor